MFTMAPVGNSEFEGKPYTALGNFLRAPSEDPQETPALA